MADFSDLVVKLELQQAQFQRGMDQAARSLSRVQAGAKGAQSSMGGLEKSLQGVAQAAAAVGVAFAAIKTLQAIATASDQVRNLQGSFTALLGSADRASDMLARVFGIVERTGVPLEAAAGASQRLAIALRDLGASNQQIETIAETFIQLGKVGGASAAETAGALQQLGQALASGKLGGDELRSIRENAPLVADAIAKSMGVTSGALKQLGEDGKLTADVVANALIKASGAAAAAFAQLPTSFEQALNKMQAQAVQTTASFDKIAGITQAMVLVVDNIAAAFKRWNDELSQTNKNLNATQLVAELIGDLARLAGAAFVAWSFALETIVKRIGFIAEQVGLILQGDWDGVIASSNRWRQELEKSAEAAERTIRALLKMEPLAATAAQARGAARGDELRGTPPANLKHGAGVGGGGSGKNEAEELRKKGEALAAAVNVQNALNQKLAEYKKLLEAGAISEVTYARAVEEANRQRWAANDAMRAAVDPVFEYNKRIEELDRLLQQNVITLETWTLAYDAANKKLTEEAGKGKDQKKSGLEELTEKFAEGVGDDMKQFFDDLVDESKTADQAFAAMAKSIISNLAKLLTEFAAAQAAKFIISSLLGGGPTPSGSGSLFAAPALLAAAPAPFMLAAAPSFNAAASLAGPLAAPADMTSVAAGTSSGRGSPWNVTINNNAPVDVTATPRDGGLEVTIERMRSVLAQDVVRGGNNFSRAMESAYGLGRGR